MSTEQPFRIVGNLRKSGQLQEAWNYGFSALEQSPQDSYLKGALFWVCYEFIKQQQEKIAKRGASSNNYRPSDFEFDKIESLLQTIVNFEIPAGGLEHKMLLVQFKKNLEWFPTLIHLVLRQKAALFDDDAKKPFQAEKGEAPSLMLSTARQVASAWLRAREPWQLDLNQVMEFIHLTRQQASDVKHMIWLDYDQAKCLIVAGQYEQARSLILPILRKKQKEAWAWGALAATYQKQNRDLAMKFFAKGIVSAHDVTFSLKLFQGIIPLLLGNQRHVEASMCLKTALSAYQAHGWKIKPELEQLSLQPWYDSSVDEKQLNPFLNSISRDAQDYIYGPTKKVIAIIENIHRSGKGFHAYVTRTYSTSVRLGLHKSKENPKVGDYVELTLREENGQKDVVSSLSCGPKTSSDISEVKGRVNITPKGFGFVEDTYIPRNLVADMQNDTLVTVTRVMSWDKTKSKYSWKAIKLKHEA